MDVSEGHMGSIFMVEEEDKVETRAKQVESLKVEVTRSS
jgi:hypothetical protein